MAAPDTPRAQARAFTALLMGESRQDTPAAWRRKRRVWELARARYEDRPLRGGDRRWLVRWLEYAAQRPGARGDAARRAMTWLIETGAR